MPLRDDLSLLEADLPACPRTLLDMLMLINDESASVSALAAVIERDMALAAAVVRTVNSAMYGVLRRVETVHEAIQHVGTREVAAITFSTALRAAFPATPAFEALWDFASRCSLLMGRSATTLGLDPWQAHTAGLFARCGQAVLMAKYPDRYAAVTTEALGASDEDRIDQTELAAAERRAFGVDHATYGCALCAAWGLSPDVVKYLRERIQPSERWLVFDAPLRDLLTLGAMAEGMIDGSPPERSGDALNTTLRLNHTDTLLGALLGPWQTMMGASASSTEPSQRLH